MSWKADKKRGTRYSFRYMVFSAGSECGAKSLQGLEARVRIELTHKGFADLSLTTWVPRRLAERMWCGVASRHACTIAA
jgi:hypothetical protein